MNSRHAGLLIVFALLACDRDTLTTPEDASDDGDAPAAAAASNPDGYTASSADECLNCTFEPRLFTRERGTPVTEVIEFPGDPVGAYTLVVDDLGTRGANSSILLNGAELELEAGEPREVALEAQNTLHVRLTGEPGSQLRVELYQEIATIEVTPAAARSRIPASQEFTAVARDRNGAAIPRQTVTWETPDAGIATIGSGTGIARTVGLKFDNAAFNYHTTSTGAGEALIVARADGAPEHTGTADWTVVQGFVYTTWTAPRRLDDPKRGERPNPMPYRYDEARLQAMDDVCAAESSNEEWVHLALNREQLFRQCYYELAYDNPTRNWFPLVGYLAGDPHPNVGLYGRYCGGGHPGSWWDTHAREGNYQPRDPVDAICMQHDIASGNHDENGSLPQGTCIVQYGVYTSTLHFEGALVTEGSPRWNEFWSRWPEMKTSRDHWLLVTAATCSGPVWNRFLENRGL